MKYLILVVFIAIVWRIWKKRNQRTFEEQQPAIPEPQKMLVCHYCGVHFPENDGISGQSGTFCSDAHRTASGQGRG